MTTKGWPPSLGIKFIPLQIGPHSTKVPLCKTVNVLKIEKAFENTQPKSNDLDSP